MSWFEKLSMLVTGIGFYNCVRFVWSYGRLRNFQGSPLWKSSPHGRYMMWTAAVLGSLFALILSNRLFPGWPGREIVTLALYVTYVAFTGWLNKLLDLSTSEQPQQETAEEAA